VVSDTWHPTVAEAMVQARFEFTELEFLPLSAAERCADA
jgi:hypothetical protein